MHLEFASTMVRKTAPREFNGVDEEVTALLDIHSPERGGEGRSRTQCSRKVSEDDKQLMACEDGNLHVSACGDVQGDGGESRPSPLKILFLSSDTGGGHRASAESLFQQFLKQYPGSECEIVDFWPENGWCCCRDLPGLYRFSSRNPVAWWIQYHVANWPPFRFAVGNFLLFSAERNIRWQIGEIDPDVVVSVHPLSNYVPPRAVRNLSREKGRYIPFFTVVTDYGSGHSTWFERRVDKCYVASYRMRALAKERGVPDRRVVKMGLPIREEFDMHASAMGDRTSKQGQQYQELVRSKLLLDLHTKVILVMGGGEGYGPMDDIVKSLYVSLSERGVDATVVAICGRNDELKAVLKGIDRELLLEEGTGTNTSTYAGLLFLCFAVFAALLTSLILLGVIPLEADPATSVATPMALLLSACAFVLLRLVTCARCRGHTRSTRPIVNANGTPNASKKGNVKIEALGFVDNIAEYMVASDVVVSKAGPGTIAEATALGLPIMLTSFMPGQEFGNIKIVAEKGFGAFCPHPNKMAETVSSWLLDDSILALMSRNSAREGNPACAADIVRDIGHIVDECRS